MTVNFSNSMVGLSLLTGSNVFSSGITDITFESRAVRKAKAQFTMEPTTTPPWKEEPDSSPLSTQASMIKAMKTIIDKAGTGVDFLPEDVQTTFTTYKALDRLRVLAEVAADKTTSDAQRKALQKSFAAGMGELKGFLTSAPSDKVSLSYFQPARNVKSIGIPAADQYTLKGPALVDRRTDAVPGLTGQEQFSITLTKPGASDTVTVDLSTGPQPPSLDDIVVALNGAIKSVPQYNGDGSVKLDGNGDPIPRWLATFEAEKGDDGWGLTLKTPSGIERVTMDQIGAKDSLIVATGQTPLDAPSATQVFRLDDPAGGNSRVTLATVSALDRQETERNKLLGKTTTETNIVYDQFGNPELGSDGKVKLEKIEKPDVQADTDAAAVTTDRFGNSYIVGTTAGDLGSNRSDGDDNLFLTKLDGEGNVMWQRSLGSGGASQGASVHVDDDGSVTVAGTVNGGFDDMTTDGDMLVARFDENGDEQFATVVRATGADTAKALAVAADGSIYVGGRAASGGGDAFIARIGANGVISERRTINIGGSESVNALTIDKDGNLLAAINKSGNAQIWKIDGASLSTDLGQIDLGRADARVLSVADDGTIAVGGTTEAVMTGTQTNGFAGARDGFVATIDANLTASRITYIGTAEDDQVDSIAFLNGELYAGGRTKGDLGATRRGPTDGFVTRIDMASGAIQSTSQFGQSLLRTEPVRISADPGGAATGIKALGFGRGTINPESSELLTSQTAIRAGDTFSIRLNGGATRKITIDADETMKSLTEKLSKITGSKATVTTSRSNGERTLRITAKEGNAVDLIAGAEGRDVLEKLGIDPQRIETPEKKADNAPKVSPGGTYGLMLTDALNLTTAEDAKIALKKMKDAVSMSQTAYRSLFWDDAKATLVDGEKNSAYGKYSTARENAQLKNYQAALDRLSGGGGASTSLIGF
ncbi:NHL repeat-containing protein [Stakelama tenebrarum]|uniref:Regulatory protein FlaEY n=1 Tax=Stakelama tenebrarum TaxID=2711215 RepID=A0A6G6Y434_9SPHN|nr:SBBP repeat-containing protein [Sphingosinithalassobacter tenebrarum]QIG79692.1 hypothetical protein G5C33_07725 [Sphingosinithalassobacter tenebrarum]